MRSIERSRKPSGVVAVPRVLVVEDDRLLGQVIAGALHTAGLASTVASTLEQARSLLTAQSWCGFVVDIGLPDGSGVELVAPIRRLHLELPILVMTGGDVAQHTHVALEHRAMFTTKPLPSCWVRVFTAAVTGANARPSPRDALDMLGLTSAQLEVFTLLIEGLTAAEVAARLGVQPTTVRTHCANVYRDLHVSGLAEVLAMAAGWGRLAG
jgi:DNA-binding NarL/FixJ family response regulator